MTTENSSGEYTPNILIVDDIPDNLKVLGGILKDKGYKIRPVLNGELALQVAEKEKPDLILLDIMMPGLDGYQVCRLLKENPHLKDIPVIFISALNETKHIVNGFIFGGVDYITKPFRAEEVTVRVATHLKISRQSKELKELNAAKDKFFSIITHDLKSPFNSIVGFSNLLIEQVRQKKLDGIEEYAGFILQSSSRAMDLLKNLIEWSRSQTGRMEFSPDNIEMVELINEVILLLNDTAKQKSIIITKSLPSYAFVFADMAMINTILRNLITNAIKFTRPGGMINILIEKTHENLMVSISDNGVGIPKDRIDKLFCIDENQSTNGTNNEKGTGLGLILCKDFVEKHRGKIWVQSEVGKGSTFVFTIPEMQ